MRRLLRWLLGRSLTRSAPVRITHDLPQLPIAGAQLGVIDGHVRLQLGLQCLTLRPWSARGLALAIWDAAREADLEVPCQEFVDASWLGVVHQPGSEP